MHTLTYTSVRLLSFNSSYFSVHRGTSRTIFSPNSLHLCSGSVNCCMNGTPVVLLVALQLKVSRLSECFFAYSPSVFTSLSLHFSYSCVSVPHFTHPLLMLNICIFREFFRCHPSLSFSLFSSRSFNILISFWREFHRFFRVYICSLISTQFAF